MQAATAGQVPWLANKLVPPSSSVACIACVAVAGSGGADGAESSGPADLELAVACWWRAAALQALSAYVMGIMGKGLAEDAAQQASGSSRLQGLPCWSARGWRSVEVRLWLR